MDFKLMIVVFLVLSVCQVNGSFGQEEDNLKSMTTLMREMDSMKMEIDSIKRSMDTQEKKKPGSGGGKPNQVSCDQVKSCFKADKAGDNYQPEPVVDNYQPEPVVDNYQPDPQG